MAPLLSGVLSGSALQVENIPTVTNPLNGGQIQETKSRRLALPTKKKTDLLGQTVASFLSKLIVAKIF